MDVTALTTREACLAADEEDPLARFADEFALPEGVVYLDGNSLGARPKAASVRAAEVVTEEWGSELIRAWNTRGWFDLPQKIGEKVGRLVGAGEGTTVVSDTTSANIFKTLSAALRIQAADHPERRVVITERDNFPTDVYIAQGLIDQLDRGYELVLVDEDLPLSEALDERTAVVLLSHVNYRTGRMWDMSATTSAIHDAGALVVWDLCHAAGAVPVDLTGAGADFAVGCTYKYLNGGPGSPAFIWVAPEHQNRFWQPLSGWWSHATPFAMSDDYTPADGIKRFLSGTQPITSLALVETGVDILLSADTDRIREKSLAQTNLFIQLVETRCAGFGLELVTPRSEAERGSHVSFAHPHGFEVMQALIARGVIGDYREPSVLRFGITPLYLSFADVWDAVETLRDILATESWRAPEFAQRGAVT